MLATSCQAPIAQKYYDEHRINLFTRASPLRAEVTAEYIHE